MLDFSRQSQEPSPLSQSDGVPKRCVARVDITHVRVRRRSAGCISLSLSTVPSYFFFGGGGRGGAGLNWGGGVFEVPLFPSISPPVRGSGGGRVGCVRAPIMSLFRNCLGNWPHQFDHLDIFSRHADHPSPARRPCPHASPPCTSDALARPKPLHSRHAFRASTST